MFVYNRKCTPSLLAHFPSFASSWRAMGTKTSWSLCLCWRNAALGFSRRRESRDGEERARASCEKSALLNGRISERLSSRLRGILFHLNITWNATHIKVLSRIFTCFKKALNKLELLNHGQVNCIWCEWWPVDSDKLNEFVLASCHKTSGRTAMCVRCPREPVKSVEMCGAEKILFQMKLITCDPI